MAEQVPQLSPDIINLSWEAARAANRAFDTMQEADGNLETIKEADRLSVTGVTINGEAWETLELRLNEAEINFDLLVYMAGVAMYQPEDGDTNESPWSAATAANVEIESVEDLLSPEQQTHADAIVTAMAEKLGIEQENIRLVLENTPEDGKRVVAIDASPNGQYLGSYNDITKKQAEDAAYYSIDVDGEQIGILAGMTSAAYDAMIADAKSRRVSPLPDSAPLSQQNAEPWTWTMLTGESLTADGRVQIRGVHDGQVSSYAYHPDHDNRNLRVRPAVVVAKFES